MAFAVLSPTKVRCGDRIIDVETAPWKALLKLRTIILASIDENTLGLKNSFALLKLMDADFIKEPSQIKIHQLRTTLLAFVEQWFALAPTIMPEGLKDAAELFAQKTSIQPFIKESKLSGEEVIVVTGKGGEIRISKTLGKLQAKILECEKQAASVCLQKGSESLDCESKKQECNDKVFNAENAL